MKKNNLKQKKISNNQSQQKQQFQQFSNSNCIPQSNEKDHEQQQQQEDPIIYNNNRSKKIIVDKIVNSCKLKSAEAVEAKEKVETTEDSLSRNNIVAATGQATNLQQQQTNRSFCDNIICTIGQKIPTATNIESIVTVKVVDCATVEMNSNEEDTTAAMMLSLEDSENYYEELYEIDLNSGESGSGTGSRRSSYTSDSVAAGAGTGGELGCSKDLRLIPSSTKNNNNIVTCSITNVNTHNNCNNNNNNNNISVISSKHHALDGHISATVTSTCHHHQEGHQYSNVPILTCAHQQQQQRPQLPLPSTYSTAGLKQLLQLNGPIPPLTILNSDGTINRTITTENELDSLDLTLFEKKKVVEAEEEEEEAEDFESSLPFIRTKSKRRTLIHNSNSNNVASNYWLDAGNEFEFISAASVINNQNCNKSQDGFGNRKLNTNKSSLPTTPASPTLPIVSSIKPISSTDKVIMEEENNDNYEEFTICNSHPRVTYRSSSACNSLLPDTSYDKAIGGNSSAAISIHNNQSAFNRRRGSLPLNMTSGIVVAHEPGTDNNTQQTSSTSSSSTGNSSSLSSTSRLVNFFAKRSFKVSSGNQLLNRAKSSNKLDQKVVTNSSAGNNVKDTTIESQNRHSEPSTSTSSNSSPAHLINAQSIHPSVINNQHGFVTTSSDGSEQYYSCKTRLERDTWLHAIQQSINNPEKSRIENSLTIWILEGKDIGKSNRNTKRYYHCELYLNNKLYGRTNGKTKNEMLFWGEEFVFNQLQINSSTELFISLWRKESCGKKNGSSNKRKKEKKKELIGSVKIPLKSLQSRNLIEKWYPLTLDVPSSKSKPTLRLKCKYETINILPLSNYQQLLQFVQEDYKLLCEHLETLLNVKGKEDIAEIFINIFHQQSIAKRFVADLALNEIIKGGDDKLTFRSNSIATKSMESYLKLLGQQYLETTLSPLIQKYQNIDCEVDPMRIDQITNLNRNQSNLRYCVDNIWKSIINSVDLFPAELKECFSICRGELRNVEREELTGHLISASIFLRYICPAILSPSLFHLTNEYPNEKSARNLMLIAKVIQTIANFTRFSYKENYMEFINDYVDKEGESMKSFLLKISPVRNSSSIVSNEIQSVQQQLQTLPTIDLGKWLSNLVTLLSESIDKFITKSDKFKILDDILKRLKTAQHSPPPTTSPPPAPLPISIPSYANQEGVPAYAIGNVISQSAIPVHVVQHFRTTGGQSPEPQTGSSGYQSQSPVMQSYSSTPLNFSNPVFDAGETGMQSGGEKVVAPQRITPMSRQTFSSSSCTDDEDEENYARTVSSTRPTATKLRPLTNPMLQKNQLQFRSTAALELHNRSSHPLVRPVTKTYNNLSSSDSDSGIANNSNNGRSRKIKYLNTRRSPDGCQEPTETKTLEEYENEMIELRQAMEVLQMKLSRAEERLFRHSTPQSGLIPPIRPKSSTTAASTADLVQEKRLSTASSRELEMEGLLQRLLSAEEEMKREQELLSALDQKQKLIDAQEQKINQLDTVNTQLITALSKIHSSIQQPQQQRSTDPAIVRPNSLPLPSNNTDIVNNNNNSTIVRITTGESSHPIVESNEKRPRSMSPDSLNGTQPTLVQNASVPPAATSTAADRVIIGEHELKRLVDLKSSSC